MDKPLYYFNGDKDKAALDFPKLGFDYIRCPFRFEAVYDFGVWRVRGLLEDNQLHLVEGSQSVHYGQQLFEGMKVQTGADGKVYAFRPYENACRINEGARYMCGAEIPEELFVRGVEDVTRANLPFVPPYGSGAALYVRPFWLGVDDNVGVKPARKYIFRIFVTPVGPYFPGGFGPDQGKSFMVSPYDRAAPQGTGHIKAGGNYAGSFLPTIEARKAGFADAIFMDPAGHRNIEEIGAANFIGFKGDTLVTVDSPSILHSITRRSLLQIAEEDFGWKTEERTIPLEELSEFDAAACCGTAAVLTWIKSVHSPADDKTWNFPFDERWQKLYDRLTGIQTAQVEDARGWRYEITP